MIPDTTPFLVTGNGRSVPLAQVPVLDEKAFREALLDGVSGGGRVVAYFGTSRGPDLVRLYAALADDEANTLHVGATDIEGPTFVSLTPECPQVHLFECEIAEQFGLIPQGHPRLRPVRYRGSWTARDAWGRGPEAIPPSDQIHEVSVGPVHAGIIEPGHFRFQCRGEQVLSLEIALGFQHRGIEEGMKGGPDKRTLHWAETVAGDTTVGHSLCYSQVIEALASTRISARAHVLRGIALELERLANHVGDLGALAGDVGFLPTASYCGRIRGDFLKMTALMGGNRFGRGLVRPGGGFDLDQALCETLLAQLTKAEKDTAGAVNLLWENQSVMARFEDTGHVSAQQVRDWGLVGPTARASGVSRDSRFHQPSGIYRMAQVPLSTCDTGDVFGRAYVRWLETQQSAQFIRDQWETLPTGLPLQPVGPLAPDSLCIALNEGWRGEICHVAMTDGQGRFARYKMIDPSFHNWAALELAMKNQEIADFPLCNKSFNLSYCGHDL